MKHGIILITLAGLLSLTGCISSKDLQAGIDRGFTYLERTEGAYAVSGQATSPEIIAEGSFDIRNGGILRLSVKVDGVAAQAAGHSGSEPFEPEPEPLPPAPE